MLYMYQQKAVEVIVSDAAQPTPARRVLVAPTGSGKTVIAVEAIKQLGRRTLFVAHTREIIGQTYRRLLSAGLTEAELGVVMADDARTNVTARVQVASIQTLARRDAPAADIIFVDECHHATAGAYRKLIEKYPAAHIFGLTATPQRLDGEGLEDLFHDLTVVSGPSWLIEAGCLAEPIVYSAPQQTRDLLRTRMQAVTSGGADYGKASLAQAMRSKKLIGNIIDEWFRINVSMRPTVVFASSVQHSKDIAARFRKRGVKAAHLDGETSVADRDRLLVDLAAGTLQVLCNCDVLGEGWDSPTVKCVVLARPTKSLTKYMQQCGRILRPYKHQRPIVLDHANNFARHGFPHSDREWTLSGEERAGKGAPAPVRVCANPACNAVLHASTVECPECGTRYIRPPTEEETRIQLEQQKSDAQLEHMVKWAKKHGHPEEWARKVHADVR